MGDGRELTIEELAARAGVSVRTVRYYIAEGLLPGPGGRGTAATYGEDHLLRLRLIRRLAESGLSLAEIKNRRLTDLSLEEVRAILAEDNRQEEHVKQADPKLAPKDYVAALLNRARRARHLAEGTATASPGPALAPRADIGPEHRGRDWLRAQPGLWDAAPSQLGVSPTAGDVWHRFELTDGVELHVREDVLRRAGSGFFATLQKIVSLFRRTRR